MTGFEVDDMCGIPTTVMELELIEYSGRLSITCPAIGNHCSG